MAHHIEDEDIERLAAEIAALTGDPEMEAVRRTLLERRARLTLARRRRAARQIEALRRAGPSVSTAEVVQALRASREGDPTWQP